jgi:sucrose-6-phosphate hydrolase SacC (GH32 family)
MKTPVVLLSGMLMVVAATAGAVRASSPFDDAVTVWHMANWSDAANKDSPLSVTGNVKCGLQLDGAERDASLKRGGDGYVAQFEGGWLDAGQGADGKLNLTGNALTMALRLRSPSGKWGDPLMAKHGGHTKEVYNVFSANMGTGNVFGAEVGSDEVAGMHQVTTPIAPLGATDWHDVIVRWNGKALQLFVDGGLRDEDVAVGVLRQGNVEPLLIGAESAAGQVNSGFRGLIDHAALWNRALSDAEIASLSGVAAPMDKRPQYYSEKYRPQFHFTAQKHWINDPNGLFCYKGVYHMCFQHRPPGHRDDFKDWGHAVSTDLVHWRQLATSALTPHKVWGGCWSGSAVVDWHNTTGFQAGDDKPIVAILTNGGSTAQSPGATQCIAFSTDGGNTFTYYDKNPVLAQLVAANRDPKVIWYAPTEKWIMALYLTGNDYGLFASPDLKTWEHLCDVTLAGVSECPDLFELPVDGDSSHKKWVFWGASGGFLLGTFDGRTFTPEGALHRADYGGNFYAAQTWSDIPVADGRRLQIAWMAGGNYPGMPFTQQRNFPTEVTLRTTPEGIEMFRVPVREIEKLRMKEHRWVNVVLHPGNNFFSGLTGELFDICAEFELGDARSFGITVRGEPVEYDVATHTLSCLGKSAPLHPENGRIKLRILVDRTSLEVFGNDGRVVLTSCFLPSDENQQLEMHAISGNVKVVAAEVYPLQSIWRRPLGNEQFLMHNPLHGRWRSRSPKPPLAST